MDRFFSTLHETIAANRAAVVASIVEAQGSTPRKVGAKMIVAEDNHCQVNVYYSIGGGPLEAQVIEDAKELLRHGEPCIKQYHLNQSDPLGLFMTCGGSLRIFFEPIRPPDELYIFGSGTVALAVAEKARGLGFAITIFDDRPERFELFKDTAKTIEVDWTKSQTIPNVEQRYVLILTRCHRFDKRALANTVGRGAHYIGLMGSKRKIVKMREELEQELNMNSSTWTELHAPVGQPIGSDSPEEIAISIWAQIICMRHKQYKRSSSSTGNTSCTNSSNNSKARHKSKLLAIKRRCADGSL